jgi:polysaccharide deacetylase family protein (PEP-CTERM system associated)
MKNILSVDVEDWFHILALDSTPDVLKWSRLESRVESNFHNLLDIFDEVGAKATCFFLGWVAENFPHLVTEAVNRGHEIASHGYAHELTYMKAPVEFAEDIRISKNILEDIAGSEVLGYRTPGFSITPDTPWAFDELCAAGYSYDSSVFPAGRGHGGMRGSDMFPHVIETASGSIVEFPITVIPVMYRRLCFFGGGYLRLFPYALISRMSRKVNDQGRPVIYYVHPREIDLDHPRLDMSRVRRFKSYVNLKSTKPKLERLLRDQVLVPFSRWLDEYPQQSNGQHANT